ncbi:Hypothetical predicted protein [Olea europaea subsp. europaea]|uniref:Uncharacterized protein n=1 Tax=Olea europaea subsp. europaea TaxID=158383 RepID=A0A8S0V4B7_OLEEU|nr:Hypothetical predicted protein [Olea europaea subsp. europaea]
MLHIQEDEDEDDKMEEKDPDSDVNVESESNSMTSRVRMESVEPEAKMKFVEPEANDKDDMKVDEHTREEGSTSVEMTCLEGPMSATGVIDAPHDKDEQPNS